MKTYLHISNTPIKINEYYPNICTNIRESYSLKIKPKPKWMWTQFSRCILYSTGLVNQLDENTMHAADQQTIILDSYQV